VRICKRSMASVLPAFNSERVLGDYLHEFYGPAARHGRVLAADDFKAARELGTWKEKVRAAWPGVTLKLLASAATEISFADRVSIEVEVTLNGLAPSDVRVECQVRRVLGSELVVPVQGYAENRRPKHGLSYLEGRAVLLAPFTPGDVDAAGTCRYRLELEPPWAGTLEYEVRAVPDHPRLSHPYELGLMRRL
jgi:starch phosphorylase